MTKLDVFNRKKTKNRKQKTKNRKRVKRVQWA